MSQDYQPDLTGAEVYVENTDQPIAGGRWYILPDDSVAYQQPKQAELHRMQRRALCGHRC